MKWSVIEPHAKFYYELLALGDVGRPGKTTENSVVVVPGPGVEGGGLGGGPHPGVLEVCGEVLHVGGDGGLEETPRKVQVAKGDEGEGS